MAKQGSTVSGLVDSFATMISLAIQYGVPLEVLVCKFRSSTFEPLGRTTNRDIPIASSIVDYIFSWLGLKFLSVEKVRELGLSEVVEETVVSKPASRLTITSDPDAPPCHDCGAIMIRSGTCYRCQNCGVTTGCGG